MNLIHQLIHGIQQILQRYDLKGSTHFSSSPPKSYYRTLDFLNLYQHAKTQLNSSPPFWVTIDIWVITAEKPHLFYYHREKNIKVTFSFPVFVSACQKVSFFNQYLDEIQPILDFYGQKDHTHFSLCTHTQKFFTQTLIFTKILKIQSCNLIRQEHFGPSLRNLIFL